MDPSENHQPLERPEKKTLSPDDPVERSCDGVPAELPSWDDCPEFLPEEPRVRFPGLHSPADYPIFF